jgi:hypothetical protein
LAALANVGRPMPMRPGPQAMPPQGAASQGMAVQGKTLQGAASQGMAPQGPMRGTVAQVDMTTVRTGPGAAAMPAPQGGRQTAKKPNTWIPIAMVLVTLFTVILLMVIHKGLAPKNRGGWGWRESMHERSLAADHAKENAALPQFQPNQASSLRASKGQRVRVEGVLADVRESVNSRYLEFSNDAGPEQIAVRILAREAPGLTHADLKALVGKKLKVAGEVWLETDSGRVVVDLTDKADLLVDN